MKLLQEYTFASNLNSVEFVGLDSELKYPTLQIFCNVQCTGSSLSDFYIGLNHNPSTSYTMVNRWFYVNTNLGVNSVVSNYGYGILYALNPTGQGSQARGYGIVTVTGRKSGDVPGMFCEFAMSRTTAFNGNPGRGYNRAQASTSANASNITSIKFSAHPSVSIAAGSTIHIYGS
jgi:hypothetical protein